jgi:thiol-disulfide isomerase/thioredoxin
MDTLALIAAAALIAVSTAIGFIWRAGQGRVRRGETVASDIPTTFINPDSSLTLLQFSGEYCSYCPLMRKHLQAVAAEMPGVDHTEIDIAEHSDLTAKLHIMQTPTTLLVSPRGRILARISGVSQPTKLKSEVTAALAAARMESDDYLI